MNDDDNSTRAQHDALHASLDTYGADVTRWPADRRPAPAQLTDALGRDATLAAAFAREQALDLALQAADLAAGDDLRVHRLQQRILASLPAQHSAPAAASPLAPPPASATVPRSPPAQPARARGRLPWPLRTALGPALAALVPLVLGFGAGVMGADTLDPDAGASYDDLQAATAPGGDAEYADETTMAPFLVASTADAPTSEWQP